MAPVSKAIVFTDFDGTYAITTYTQPTIILLGLL